MEIRLGEYVRTKNGIIAKVIGVQSGGIEKYFFDKEVHNLFNYLNGLVVENVVVKHSFNIIDLIEKGDYINGYKVLDIDFKNEMICLLMPFDEENKSKYNIVWNTKYFIKSIVTKEMFQNIEYRVESN